DALGAAVTNVHVVIDLEAAELHGARLCLDVVSDDSTINVMLAAEKAKRKRSIENAGKEPEISDGGTLLTSMGANIKGGGTDIIRNEGVEKLHGCRHTIIPDRIEAGTYMIAASAMGKEVIIDNTIPEHLESLIAKLREMGVRVEQHNEQVLIAPKQSLKAV